MLNLFKARGHSAIRCTLLLQLHFSEFNNAYLVPIELILCIMEKIVLSPIWCDFIRDKMSIKTELSAVAATLHQGQDEHQDGVECSCSNKVALKVAQWPRAFRQQPICCLIFF